jgi:mono/diheme cytochrome c family protein
LPCGEILPSAKGLPILPELSMEKNVVYRSANFLIISLSFTLLLLLSACSFSLAEDLTPPPGAETPVIQDQPTEMSGPFFPLVAPVPAEGAAIYAEKCAPCHGDSGLGNGPQANELSVPVTAIGDPAVARQSTPSEWFRIVTQGNLEKFMPPFTSLSDPERWDVVAYVYQLSMPAETLALGEQVYQANCAGCHGELGRGDGPQAGQLSTKPRDFSNQAWMAERTEADFFATISQGKASGMPAFADKLNEEERWAAAGYLRTLSFMNSATQAASEPAASSQTDELSAAGTITVTNPLTSTQTGPVAVQLINGSGGEVPAGLPVTLYGFDSMQLVYTETVTSQANGMALFAQVPKPLGRAFLAGVDYQETTAGSDVLSIEDPTVPVTLTVTIFDTTTDTAGLLADRMHIFFEFIEGEQVQVVEVFVISNPTNQAVVAAESGGPVVSFLLPEGAMNLQFQDGTLGDRYLETPDGFADTVSVQPGTSQYQVIFAYTLPYPRKLELKLPLGLPVDSAIVMLPDVGVKLKSGQLEAGESRDVQGTKYLMFSGGAISAGGTLEMALSGNPKGSSSSLLVGSDNRTNLLIGLGALGVVLIVVGVWFFFKSRSVDEDGEEVQGLETESGDIPQDPDSLMDAMIALDDLYKAGELPEEAYQQRRGELKAKLNRLLGKES